MNKRLKELRKTLGLKQREFAERLGVSAGYVANLESGSDAPARARIYQICHEFNVRREWLEKGEGEMFEPTGTQAPPPAKDARDLQVEFCQKMFDALPRDVQETFLQMLRERLGIDV